MNVVIIEDERLTAQRLASLVHKYDPSIRVLAQMASVVEAISWFETNTTTFVDLVFMDIHLEAEARQIENHETAFVVLVPSPCLSL